MTYSARRWLRWFASSGALFAVVVGLTSACSPERNVRAGLPVESPASATDLSRSMATSVPRRVQIPALGVDTGLIALGLETDGTMKVPPNAFPAGWFTGAPTPGELGPAIIVGHVDWHGQRGVFFDLHKVKPGDHVTILRADRSRAVFLVDRVQAFAKDEFPTDLVYGNTRHAALRLITCGGTFDRQKHRYQDNVIVFAQLAPAPSTNR